MFKLWIEWEPSPLRLLVNQASDLALHGVLDIAWGVEAYRSVVGRTDYLTLLIDVRCRNERLSSPVVTSANRSIFLLGEQGSEVIIEIMMSSKMAAIIFNKRESISHTLSQTCCSASRFILYGWDLPSSVTRGDHSLDSFLEIKNRSWSEGLWVCVSCP